MRDPWGLFSGSAALDEQRSPWSGVPRFSEISEEWAIQWLAWVLGHDLAYDTELVPADEASELALGFADLLPLPRRWFSNTGEGDSAVGPRGLAGLGGWNPMTSYTFDTGVIATGDDRAYIAWFTGED